MAIYRLQTIIGADSAFPRDRFVINPHFENTGGVLTDSDTQQLCEDLADAMVAYVQGTREIRVKCYDAQGTPPVFPVGEAVRNADQFPVSAGPRELAICLSFYGTRNLPTQRGRVFVPWPLITGGDTPGDRPGTTRLAKVGALATIFKDLGGVDVDWTVYSRKLDVAHKVTNWWVDDEWDVMRSRGLRPLNRITGTTDE